MQTENPLQNAYIGEYVEKPFTPWANTIAYRPLTSSTTVNDQSWNNKNLTNHWGVTFGTYGGVSCVSFDNTQTLWLTSSLWMTWNPIFTFNVRICRVGYSTWTPVKSQIFMLWPINTNTSQVWVAINWAWSNEYQYWTWGSADVDTWAYNTANVWELVTFTNDGTTKKFYKNWTLIKQWSLSYNISGWDLTIWSFSSSFNSHYQSFYGYMSEFIVENKVRTAQEITDYYNASKSIYGL